MREAGVRSSDLTTQVLRRLLDRPASGLVRADLIVQWEVARKRAGRPCTALSAAWSPWWRFSLGGRIARDAFRPRPRVDAGILVVERRAQPLLPPEAAEPFAAFVHGLFRGTLARQFDTEHWTALFGAYVGGD